MIWQCLGCSAKAAKGRFSSAFTFKTTFTFEKSQDLFFFGWLLHIQNDHRVAIEAW